MSLTLTVEVHHVRPSGDILFGSVSVACGVTLSQDEASSKQFSMPRAIIATGGVGHALTLNAIAPMLLRLVSAA